MSGAERRNGPESTAAHPKAEKGPIAIDGAPSLQDLAASFCDRAARSPTMAPTHICAMPMKRSVA